MTQMCACECAALVRKWIYIAETRFKNGYSKTRDYKQNRNENSSYFWCQDEQ